MRRKRPYLAANFNEIRKIQQPVIDDDVQQPLLRTKQGKRLIAQDHSIHLLMLRRNHNGREPRSQDGARRQALVFTRKNQWYIVTSAFLEASYDIQA